MNFLRAVVNIAIIGFFVILAICIHSPDIEFSLADWTPNFADMMLNGKFVALVCWAIGIFIIAVVLASFMPSEQSMPTMNDKPPSSPPSSAGEVTTKGGTGDAAGDGGADGGE